MINQYNLLNTSGTGGASADDLAALETRVDTVETEQTTQDGNIADNLAERILNDTDIGQLQTDLANKEDVGVAATLDAQITANLQPQITATVDQTTLNTQAISNFDDPAWTNPDGSAATDSSTDIEHNSGTVKLGAYQNGDQHTSLINQLVLMNLDGSFQTMNLNTFREQLGLAPASSQITGYVITGQSLSISLYEDGYNPNMPHQWVADGIPISGATGVTYIVTPLEENKTITVSVNGVESSNKLTSWTPLQLPNLLHWFDASHEVASLSGNVSQWVARGSGALAAPSNSSLPPIVSSINGMPSVASHTASVNTGNLNVNGQGIGNTHTIMVAATLGPGEGGWRTLYRDYNAGHPLLIRDGNNQVAHYGGGASYFSGPDTVADFETFIGALTYDRTLGTNNLTWSKNGATKTVISSNRYVADTGTGFRLLGASTDNQGWGDVTDVILSSAVESDSDIAKTEGYLAWKTDMVGLLDPNHPYKNSPA